MAHGSKEKYSASTKFYVMIKTTMMMRAMRLVVVLVEKINGAGDYSKITMELSCPI
jgi:hypothetical protein